MYIYIHAYIMQMTWPHRTLSDRTCAGSPGVAQATVIPTAAGICEEMRWDEDGWPLSRTRFAYLASRLILERDGIATKIHNNWQCLMGLIWVSFSWWLTEATLSASWLMLVVFSAHLAEALTHSSSHEKWSLRCDGPLLRTWFFSTHTSSSYDHWHTDRSDS